MSTTKRFAVPKNGIAVADAIYPWMSAHICVFPHPFFNVTNAAGVFRIDELPPGEYVIEAWHEKLGAKQVKVSVIAGQVTRIVIRY